MNRAVVGKNVGSVITANERMMNYSIADSTQGHSHEPKARESKKELEKKRSDTSFPLGGRQLHDGRFVSKTTALASQEVGNAEESSCRSDRLNAS
jgi:hypothetical protein